MARLLLFALLLSARYALALSATPIDFSSLGNAAQPNVVADPRGGFVLSWQSRDAEGCASLKVASLARDGKLGASKTVASGCNWFVNWADMPSVVIADNGDWLSFWLQKNAADTYAYDILSSRSTDRGVSWSKPLRPHRDGTQTEHGFVAMAPAGADRVRLIWLDGRGTARAGDAHVGHAHHGTMSLRSAVLARGDQITDEAEIDPDVCSCCWPSLIRTADKSFLTAYRDHSAAEIRDIALARWQAGQWQPLGKLHDDGWHIAACPTNGPVLAARADAVLSVWPTMSDGAAMSVRAKLLSATGALKSRMRELEHGGSVLGRPGVASLGEADWLLSWLGAGAAGQSTLRVALWDQTLQERARIDVTHLPAGRSIGVPKLAANAGVAVLVWTEPLGSVPTPPARQSTRIAGVFLRP